MQSTANHPTRTNDPQPQYDFTSCDVTTCGTNCCPGCSGGPISATVLKSSVRPPVPHFRLLTQLAAPTSRSCSKPLSFYLRCDFFSFFFLNRRAESRYNLMLSVVSVYRGALLRADVGKVFHFEVGLSFFQKIILAVV